MKNPGVFLYACASSKMHRFSETSSLYLMQYKHAPSKSLPNPL